MSETKPSKIFISYNRKDATWLKRLQVHLSPLEREGLIDRWDDTRIDAGTQWQEEIERALSEAAIAVFLVSADFFASDFVHEVELPALLRRVQANDLRILVVVVGPCLFERSPLAAIQPLNSPREPLSTLKWAEQERILRNVARTVAATASARAAGTSDYSASAEPPLVLHDLPRESRRPPVSLTRPAKPSATATVRIVLEGNYEHFGSSDSLGLQQKLADFLDLPTHLIRILRVEKGSIKVTIELPAEAAKILVEAISRGDSRLLETLLPLIVCSSELASEDSLGMKATRDVAYRAVVLTALPLEYAAVREHLVALREETHRGTVYEVGRFLGKAAWDVAFVEIGAGNQPAAMEAERAILRFDPRVVAFVGVAGGIKDVRIGDVVVASKVYGYESGKAAGEFLARPDVGESSYALIHRARAEARKGEWTKRLRGAPREAPRAIISAIAAGEKVVANGVAPVAQFIRQHYSDALAIEMEGRGFLRAAHANELVQSIVVRGISDLLDGKTEADQAGSQELAADHAAAFFFEILAQHELAAGAHDRPEHLANIASKVQSERTAVNDSSAGRTRIALRNLVLLIAVAGAIVGTAAARMVWQQTSICRSLRVAKCGRLTLESTSYIKFDYVELNKVGVSSFVVDGYQRSLGPGQQFAFGIRNQGNEDGVTIELRAAPGTSDGALVMGIRSKRGLLWWSLLTSDGRRETGGDVTSALDITVRSAEAINLLASAPGDCDAKFERVESDAVCWNSRGLKSLILWKDGLEITPCGIDSP